MEKKLKEMAIVFLSLVKELATATHAGEKAKVIEKIDDLLAELQPLAEEEKPEK